MIRKNKRAQGGFTLIETILSAAILVVLLAISVTGAFLYRSHLKITELDNAAREIYLAAQNRAVLLNNRSALRPLVVRGDNELPSRAENELAYYFISSQDPQLSQLLPAGTVDPTLMNGSFYIVYEPESGSVTDVFFQQAAAFSIPGASDFNTYYRHQSYREKSARRQAEPMTGWYNGDPGEGGDAITLQPPDIIIYNEDTLRAEIKWWVPMVLSGHENDITLKMTVTYGEEGSETTVTLPLTRRISQDKRNDATSITHTDVYLLDSLFDGWRFKDLFTFLHGQLGGSFTLTAEVSYTGRDGDLQINPGRASETDNSLFAKDSTDTVANIAYMRHLQNLHPDLSAVSGSITTAVQTRTIENPSLPEHYEGKDVLEGTAPYHFTPIHNENLISYDGSRWEIRRLLIDATGNAGLFDDCVSAITDVRLMNPTVRGTEYAGTLCAQAKDGAAITGCQTYWVVDDASQMDLRYLLGTAAKDTYLLDNYMVSGGTAGGLVGAGENITIQDSSASTTVRGTTAGGLVGSGSGLAIARSYADCYLTGGSAAGLVGELKAGTNANTFTNIYAAGFISNGGPAAGLYLGSGTASVHDSYAAMGYNKRNEANILPLAPGDKIFGEDVCYLMLNFMPESTVGGQGLDSVRLTELADEGSIPGFVKKGASSTRAYNLQEEMALTSYPYPGLEGLTHYGDWPDILQINSLVYWENYADRGDYTGIYGGNANLLRNDLGVVTNDGYAVVLDKTRVDALGGIVTVVYEPASSEKSEVKYSREVLEGTVQLVQISASIGGVGGSYYLAKLPNELVNTSSGNAGFYQRITITPTPSQEAGSTQSVTDTYYYNPHFADTALAAEADRVPDPPTSVAVRSPRHLYHLSRLGVYSNNTDANCSYTFVQQLDIDYSKYTGAFDKDGTVRVGTGLSQHPVGDPDRDYVFSEVYNGGGHTIRSVPLVPGDGTYVGLFGHNSGSILNTVFLGGGEGSPLELTINASGSSITRYVGGLCGFNRGVVSNCAVAYVKLALNAYDYSTVYAGGLAGGNSGQISRSSAATDGISLAALNSNGYVGGFLGQNASGGSVDSCYALAAIAADGGSGIGSTGRTAVTAAGFAAENRGNLANSYAAADLSVSRGAASCAFCPDLSVNCCYLNNGNFVYVNDKLFSIQNEPSRDRAKALVWEKLTTPDDPENPLQGFTAGSESVSEHGHALPSIVTDSKGAVHHYGSTVTALDLGVVGMYYWEHETGGNGGYHFSAVTIDTVAKTIGERSTLCTNHADGGVIDEYGYGYFWAGSKPSFTHANITPAAKNEAVADELKKLMNNDQYQFVAYTTATASYDKGLPGTYIDGTGVSGTWSFAVGENTFTFAVNPFFADAFVLTSGKPGDYTGTLTTHVGTPGTEAYPFGVRTVAQLQLINWNADKQNCTTLTQNSGDITHAFPYLQSRNNGGKYVWRQSHDLDGQSTTTFQSIAAFENGVYTTPQNTFSGTYYGESYTIKNINISADNASTVGLWGMTLNATLKDIVLYSETGTNTVTFNNSNGNAGWYSLGGLAGYAGATVNGSGQISNCAVAGYIVRDESTDPIAAGQGGAAIGGVVGICNVNLVNCTAVATIQLNSTHSKGGGNNNERNIRVGGVAGSCKASIESCYAGGRIEIKNAKISFDTTHVRIGGIFAGCFMKDLTFYEPLATPGVSVKRCYSYVDLPNLRKSRPSDTKYSGLSSRQSKLFAIGYVKGSEDTTDVSYSNCYYLGTSTLDGNEKDSSYLYDDMDPNSYPVTTGYDITPLTHDQLSGKEPIPEKGEAYIVDSLNTGISGGAAFGTVTTTTASGQNIDGKYSYSTSPVLQGLNYPFPTILTMNDGGRTVNVHYGDWPLGGIERADGSGPVRVDLFADYQPVLAPGETEPEPAEPAPGDPPAEQKHAAYQDVYLWPSELMTKRYPDGELQVELDEESVTVCEAELLKPPEDLPAEEKKQGEMVLRITGLTSGSATVTVKYMNGETELASLKIPVEVTAELRLAPRESVAVENTDPPEMKFVPASGSAVVLIGAAKTELDLYPFDANDELIDEELWEKVTLSTGEDAFQFESQYISAVTAVDSYGDACLTAALQGAARTDTPTPLTVNYTYTYQEQEHNGSSTVICQVRTLTPEGKPLLFFPTAEGGYGDARPYGADMLSFRTEDDAITPEDVFFTSAIGGTVHVGEEAVLVRHASDGTVTVEPRNPGRETMIIGVRFSYGLCRHETMIYPVAAVYDPTAPLHLQSAALGESGLTIYTGAPEGVALTAEEAAPAAEVSVREYLAEGWTVQWTLGDALTPYLTLQDETARTAALTLTGTAPETEVLGELTVTVTTTDILDADGNPYVLNGSVAVRVIPGAPPEPTGTPEPAETPEPTETSAPTETPEPTETSAPTETPEPTETSAPTETPGPTETPEPAETPEPTETPAPTETPGPTETPEPVDTPAPDETPEPVDTLAPVDTPVPEAAPVG